MKRYPINHSHSFSFVDDSTQGFTQDCVEWAEYDDAGVANDSYNLKILFQTPTPMKKKKKERHFFFSKFSLPLSFETVPINVASSTFLSTPPKQPMSTSPLISLKNMYQSNEYRRINKDISKEVGGIFSILQCNKYVFHEYPGNNTSSTTSNENILTTIEYLSKKDKSLTAKSDQIILTSGESINNKRRREEKQRHILGNTRMSGTVTTQRKGTDVKGNDRKFGRYLIAVSKQDFLSVQVGPLSSNCSNLISGNIGKNIDTISQPDDCSYFDTLLKDLSNENRKKKILDQIKYLEKREKKDNIQNFKGDCFCKMTETGQKKKSSKKVSANKNAKKINNIFEGINFNDNILEELYEIKSYKNQGKGVNISANTFMTNDNICKSLSPVRSVSKINKYVFKLSNIKDERNIRGYYGDLSMVDFDEMDKLIAEKNYIEEKYYFSSNSTTINNIGDPMKEKILVPTSEIKSKVGPLFTSFTRYKICSVTEDKSTFTKTLGVRLWCLDKNKYYDESVDLYEDSKIAKSKHVLSHIYLQGDWFHSKCEVNDTIHICSVSGKYGTDISSLPITLRTREDTIVDDLVMVLHPNTLITPTSIGDAICCMRHSVLKYRMGSFALTSKSALIGTMRHGLFESCLLEQDFSFEFAKHLVSLIVRKHAESLVGCGIYSEEELKSDVFKIMPQILSFSQKYTSFKKGFQTNNISCGSKLACNGVGMNINVVADFVYTTEEASVAPELGVKGFVDANLETVPTACQLTDTCRVKKNCNPISPLKSNTNNLSFRSLMGIELKTGHNQTIQRSHALQLALYTLTLKSRHGSAVISDSSDDKSYSLVGCKGAANGGMLLYLNHLSLCAVHISPTVGELKSLLNYRNTVATNIRRSMAPRGIDIKYDNDDEKKDCLVEKDKIRKDFLPTPTILPDLLLSPYSCQRCYSNRECMLYAASESLVTGAPSGSNSHIFLMKHYTGHLNKSELDYFTTWDRLIDLEAFATHKELSKCWLVKSMDREQMTGQCISSLIFDESSLENLTLSNFATFEESYVIVKLTRSNSSEISTPLNALKFESGCRVVLSSDGTIFQSNTNDSRYQRTTQNNVHKMSILRGTLQHVEENVASILTNVGDVKQVSNFIDMIHERYLFNKSRSLADKKDCLEMKEIWFRLDKDEVSTLNCTLRQNLINFFTVDISPFKPPSKTLNTSQETLLEVDHTLKGRMPWLRRCIIHFDAPHFEPKDVQSLFRVPEGSKMSSSVKGCDFKMLAVEFSFLNPDQKAAVINIISAKDYALVQGLPGTGKTSTIAFVTRLLVAQGKRVLVTSYTHAAVDNLLIKLRGSGVGNCENENNCSYDLIRIGRKKDCHVDVHSILASYIISDSGYINDKVSSVQYLHTLISCAKIVGVSALTIPKSPLLTGQHFDVVIIDEAGHISQPATLGALLKADFFVLVGDHEQLPPLVHSEFAEQGGYGVSLLKVLADKFPSSVVQLKIQYRMHGDICYLCNKIVYRGNLKCADEEVGTRKLPLINFPGALTRLKSSLSHSSEIGWLLPVLNPNKPVIFVDTDKIKNDLSSNFQGLETLRGGCRREKCRIGGNIVNKVEAQITQTLVEGLLECGLQAISIGVVCPYRSQIKLLNEFDFFVEKKSIGLEISTIDKYQGRDKEVIILSLIRSNKKFKTGRLLEDYRRLNVAISRAKTKLIIIGSFRTLVKGSSVFAPILTEIKEKGWIECLPENALEVY